MNQIKNLNTANKFKDTPIGKIPVDWEVVPLSKVAEIKMGQSPSSNDCNEVNDGLPFYQGNADFGARYPTVRRWCNKPLKLAKKGDILISVRAPVGEINIAPHDCCIGRGLSALRARNIDREYLYQAILLYRKNLEKVSQGSTFDAINSKDLSDFLIFAPPHFEQKKIAEILITVDNAIEETDKIIEKTKELKKGLMQKLLTRGIRHKKFKKTEIGKIPEEWAVVSLETFSENEKSSFVNGPFGSDLLAKELTNEGVPVIYVRDIKPDRYERVSTVYVTSEKAASISFCNVKHGDVLVAKVGDPPCIAAPYLLPESSIVTQDVIRIRPAKNVDTYFLSSLINSDYGKQAVEKISIDGTRKRVSLTEFKKVLFPQPPYNEQREISIILNAIDVDIRAEEAYREELVEHKKGLMAVLLTGRVRVRA